MKDHRSRFAVLALFLGLGFSVSHSNAASLQQVNDWDKSGLPSDVSMHSYVPDQVTDNPPIVVLIHYCGGTASAVFGQAQGGGLVKAADDYGFIIIAPSSGRCWDIVSDKTRTRDGQGDSHAIRTMVTYAVDKLGGNPDRVYATGDSSGGMMTELLLGLYPDVFKAGSAMAGMPAGCRGDSESGSGGGYSNACAGGMVDRTPEAWGQIVESLSPGYMGMRPRVQIFHGDADTIISYKNHTEAIDEWTFVHDLTTTPTSQNSVTLGTHAADRATWEGDCGLPLLDAFTSKGGDHGPSDALFLADYIVPFLGLDDPGDVDPHVAACQDSPGSGGSGSGGAAGGATGSGGTTMGTGGSGVGTSGGASGVGGTMGGGMHASSGGAGDQASGGTMGGLASGGGPGASEGETPTSPGSSAKGGCSLAESRSLVGSGGSGLFTLAGLALGAVLRRRKR